MGKRNPFVHQHALKVKTHGIERKEKNGIERKKKNQPTKDQA